MPRKNLALFFALSLAAALVTSACGEGQPQPDDIVELSTSQDGERSTQAANSQTTTRAICTACGCTATFFNCRCATRRRLQCVLDGGPKKQLTFGTAVGTSTMRR